MQGLAGVQVASGEDVKCVAFELAGEDMVNYKHNHRTYLANSLSEGTLLCPELIPVVAFNPTLTCIGVAQMQRMRQNRDGRSACTFVITECVVHGALPESDQDTVAEMLLYEALMTIPQGYKVQAAALLPCPLLENSPNFCPSHFVLYSSQHREGVFVYDGQGIPYASAAERQRHTCHRPACNEMANTSCPGVWSPLQFI